MLKSLSEEQHTNDGYSERGSYSAVFWKTLNVQNQFEWNLIQGIGHVNTWKENIALLHSEYIEWKVPVAHNVKIEIFQGSL